MAEGYLKILAEHGMQAEILGSHAVMLATPVPVSALPLFAEGFGSPCRTACGLPLCPVLNFCPTGLKMQLLLVSLNDRVRETQDFCPHTKINFPFSNNLCETG